MDAFEKEDIDIVFGMNTDVIGSYRAKVMDFDSCPSFNELVALIKYWGTLLNEEQIRIVYNKYYDDGDSGTRVIYFPKTNEIQLIRVGRRRKQEEKEGLVTRYEFFQEKPTYLKIFNTMMQLREGSTIPRNVEKDKKRIVSLYNGWPQGCARLVYFVEYDIFSVFKAVNEEIDEICVSGTRTHIFETKPDISHLLREMERLKNDFAGPRNEKEPLKDIGEKLLSKWPKNSAAMLFYFYRTNMFHVCKRGREKNEEVKGKEK
jgi:hypothetical protein